MNQISTRIALESCFRALPSEDRNNLAYHHEQGTPILCGDDSGLFTDGKGGA